MFACRVFTSLNGTDWEHQTTLHIEDETTAYAIQEAVGKSPNYTVMVDAEYCA